MCCPVTALVVGAQNDTHLTISSDQSHCSCPYPHPATPLHTYFRLMMAYMMAGTLAHNKTLQWQLGTRWVRTKGRPRALLGGDYCSTHTRHNICTPKQTLTGSPNSKPDEAPLLVCQLQPSSLASKHVSHLNNCPAERETCLPTNHCRLKLYPLIFMPGQHNTLQCTAHW